MFAYLAVWFNFSGSSEQWSFSPISFTAVIYVSLRCKESISNNGTEQTLTKIQPLVRRWARGLSLKPSVGLLPRLGKLSGKRMLATKK